MGLNQSAVARIQKKISFKTPSLSIVVVFQCLLQPWLQILSELQSYPFNHTLFLVNPSCMHNKVFWPWL